MEILSLNQDHYNESYGIFMDRLGRKEWFKDWAGNAFPSAVVQKLAPDQGGDSDVFHSLGIGSADGEFELQLLSQLSKRYPRISHTVIEPSLEYIQAYQTASKTSSFEGSIQFVWFHGTLQEFMQKAAEGVPSDGGFDFICALHSLYYAEDPGQTMNFLHRALNPGGILMIEMSDNKSSGQWLFEDFPEMQRMFNQHKWVSISDIKGALSNMSVPFSCLVHLIPLDITDVFDATSPEGSLLLDFITHVSHFRKTAEEGILKKVLDSLMKKAKDYAERHSEANGKLFFEKCYETLVIEKK